MPYLQRPTTSHLGLGRRGFLGGEGKCPNSPSKATLLRGLEVAGIVWVPEGSPSEGGEDKCGGPHTHTHTHIHTHIHTQDQRWNVRTSHHLTFNHK